MHEWCIGYTHILNFVLIFIQNSEIKKWLIALCKRVLSHICPFINLYNFCISEQIEIAIPATTETLDEPTIPSTAAPVGPKPGPPRNVTIEKMAQGWVIAWLPPHEKITPVAYYRIQYKEGDGAWQNSEPISKDTAYLSIYKYQLIVHKLVLLTWSQSLFFDSQKFAAWNQIHFPCIRVLHSWSWRTRAPIRI